MTFKKLALVSAIAIAPMASYAVESLDDAALSETTGQDGIVLELDLAVATNTIVHDKDGLSGLTSAPGYSSFDGAIVINGMAVTANNVIVSLDAGDSADSAVNPVLNIRVDLTGGVSLTTGSIHVANSNRDNAGTWGVTGSTTTLINSSTLTLGATTLDVQLGVTEPQGAMVVLDAAITGGVSLSGMGITDISSGGTIGSSTMTIVDNLGTDLTVDMDINVTAAGLVIDINQLGSATGMDVQIVDQYLGSVGAGILGDIEMQGLDLAGTQITIHGK